VKKLTKKGLLKYLRANPERKFVCGDARKCVLAQYAADELNQRDN